MTRLTSRLLLLRRRKLLAIALVVLGLGITLSACGGGSSARTTSAYCDYFFGQGGQLRSQWVQAGASNTDPLQGLAAALGAPRQLADFFKHLAERAPDSIRDDVQTLSDSYKQLADRMGDSSTVTNPLTALGGALVNGLSTSGAERRVDAFTTQNCGPPPNS